MELQRIYKASFGPTGECAEDGDQTFRFTSLKGVRLVLPFGWRPGGEPLSMYPLETANLRKCYLRPALEVKRQGNTCSHVFPEQRSAGDLSVVSHQVDLLSF